MVEIKLKTKNNICYKAILVKNLFIKVLFFKSLSKIKYETKNKTFHN